MGPLAFILVGVLATVNPAHGLSCTSCHLVDCRDPPNCSYGFVKDLCGCCYVCAKGLGQSCGGMWQMQGTCGQGYTCDTNIPQTDYYAGMPQSFKEGVCVGHQPLAKVQSSSVNLLSKSRGGGATSGLLGSRRVGQAKKLVKKYKYQVIGSGIPPEYAAFLRRNNHGRRKRDIPILMPKGAGTAKLGATTQSHNAFGNIPKEYLKLLKLHQQSMSKQGNRKKRSLILPRRAGTAKLRAKTHSHNAFGNIPKEYLKLLKLHQQSMSKQGKRKKRSLLLSRIAGTANLRAKTHSHIAFETFPKYIYSS